jgi:hypothetical protein
MTYQDYEYETDTDTAPWTATPVASPAPMVAAPRAVPVVQTQAAPVAAPTNNADIYLLGSLIQSVQQSQNRQMYYLRDMDARLTRLESAAHPASNPGASTPSFERATWWAIWGLLMLILGGALAVVLLLILLNYFSITFH